MRVRVNNKSLSAKIEKLEQSTEEKLKSRLVNIAEDLTKRTPVDTGAYAESFSVAPASSGAGRSRSSKGRPKNQSLEQYRSIALGNMTADIDSLQLLENRSVSFRNRAPHADQVEGKYQVFGSAKDENR
jgi:hypothetical protein